MKKREDIQPESWIWGDPTIPGWYATIHCWDAAEGIFPSSNKWDGNQWGSSLPIVGYAGPFETQEEAESWAWEHYLT